MHFWRTRIFWLAAGPFLLSLILRLFVLIPALSHPERLERPDTPGYLVPAAALAENGSFPTTRRPPGFPALAALVFRSGGGVKTLACLLTFIAAATTLVIFFSGKLWGGPATGCCAACFHALHPTAIGNAPLLLSDTPAAFFAALQFFFFLRYWKKKDRRAILLSSLCAALGAWIRPVNSLWFFPMAFLILLTPQRAWKEKLTAAAFSLLIFFAILFPWLYRNHAAGAPWSMDTNTGAMYHQNGAMLAAAVSGRPYAEEQRRILEEQDRLFRDTSRFPDERSREAYRIGCYCRMIRAHFGIWLKQQFSWHILLPDAPAMLEAWGVTTSDRGTMAVMKSRGVMAAAGHYFASPASAAALLAISPLLLAAFCTVVGSFCRLAGSFRHLKQRWFEIIVFLGFAEYYLFLPGVITAPRYQLPALPCLCCMSALWIFPRLRKLFHETAPTAEN